MPNWKKLIVSGSDATLNSLTVTTEVVADEITANTINATTFNSTVVSSSVVFTSGSNIIGDELTDNHQITGSVFITGSLNVEGTISASYYQGDGSQLTGVQSELIEQVTVVDNFTSATTHSISHTFDTKNVNVTVYDENDDMFIPKRINTPNSSTVVIYMDTPVSGRVVISKGGHIVSGSIVTEVVETATVFQSFTDQLSVAIPHNFGSKNIITTVYQGDEQIIPKSITTTTDNVVTVTFETPTTGRAVIAKGGHLVSGVSTNGITRTVETYTATQDQTVFTTTGSIVGDNIDIYINGFKLLRSDFTVTSPNTISLSSGSSAGEQVEINLYNPFFGTYLVQEDLDGYVTGSVTGSNIVGSNTISSIETITSAAYAAITPQTDILYIITD